MKVLGIETSCDETGVAIYDSDRGLLGHELYSQVELHSEFGGVVPELAARDHIKKITPIIKKLQKQTQVDSRQLDAIAYTAGPGLAGALLVGATVAHGLAYGLGIPSVGVHHMEAHLLAPMLEDNPPEFPFVALLVSGGHTMLVRVAAFGQYEILGESLDDAAGEAFDKVAKMLGLSYPGGPAIFELAHQGNHERFYFPRPMVWHSGLNFSFSGLKTYTMTTLRKEGDDEQTKADIACAFQDAVVDTLAIKCRRALRITGFSRLLIAGGVSANKQLRHRLHKLAKKEQIELFYPRLEFCTDNGAMIAYTGCRRFQTGYRDDLSVDVFPRWSISDIYQELIR